MKITIDTIINYIYENKRLFTNQINKHIKNQYMREEIFQEFLLIVTEKKDKMIELFEKDQMKYYCLAVIKSLICNPHTPFNKNFKVKYYPIGEDLNDDDDNRYIPELSVEDNGYKVNELNSLIDEIDKFLVKKTKEDKDFWYHKELYELYYSKDMSYRSLSELTKIPVSSIGDSINYTKTLIRDEFGEIYNNTI